MIRNRFALAGASMVCLGLGGVVVSWLLAPPGDEAADRPTGLRYPDKVLLPPQRFGSEAVARVCVDNAGSVPVEITGFAASCACIDLRDAATGPITRSDRIAIAPGARAELLLTVRALGQGGHRLTSSFSFSTTDAECPTVTIPVVIEKVIREAYSNPERVVFGTYRCGEIPSAAVSIHSDTIKTVRSISARCEDPSVRVAVVGDAQSGPRPANPSAGDLSTVASVRIEVDGSSARTIDTAVVVDILDAERAHTFSIPVTCAIVPAVEVMPQQLALPRRGSAGPIYEGAAVVHSSRGEFDSLIPAAPPAGIELEVQISKGSPSAVIHVKHAERRVAGRGPRRLSLEFTVRSGGVSDRIVLPVLIRGAD